MKKLCTILLMVLATSCYSDNKSYAKEVKAANSAVLSSTLNEIYELKAKTAKVEYIFLKELEAKILDLEVSNQQILVEIEKIKNTNSGEGEVPPSDAVYPPDLPINDLSSWDTYTPVATEPTYLTPFTNSLGNTVTRVTDYTVQGTGQNLRHHYSKDQPWNSDGTMIKMAITSNTYILDGNTYEVLYQRSIPGVGTWSYTDPNIIYCLSGFNLISFDVPSNTGTTLKTFTGYSYLSYGENEGNMSTDNRYIGLQGIKGGDHYLIVYDLVNDTINEVNVGVNDPDWFSVSQSGLYAVAHYADDGSAANQGIKVYDIDMTNYRHLTDYTTHSDLGIDVDGNDVSVNFVRGQAQTEAYEYMRMHRLSDGLVTPLAIYNVSSSILYGGNLSCRNTDRPGWVYITETNGSDRSTNELVAVKLDGSVNIAERFGFHRQIDQTYSMQPHGVPNRDGTKIMFTSSWDANFNSTNGYTGGYNPAWVIEVQQ